MIKKILLVLVVGFAVLVLISLNSATEKAEEARQNLEAEEATVPAPISYTTLREWSPNKDNKSIGLEIAINPTDATKENVVALAEYFNTQSDFAVVGIYQSKEGWQAGQNNTYGDVYRQDYIGMYVKNTTGAGLYNGSNEIRWFQEIGDLQDLLGTETQIN